MPEIEIEKHIENYWGSIGRLLNDEKQDAFNEIEKQFVDPTENNPMKAVDVVKWLDPYLTGSMFREDARSSLLRVDKAYELLMDNYGNNNT